MTRIRSTRTRSAWKRLPVLVVVVALLVSFVGPAGAASDPRAQRDAVRSKKAKLAAQLDALKASEKDLLAAAAALDDQVLAQAARVAAARQATAAASAELADITSTLDETHRTIQRLTTTLVDRAVQAYMAPQRQGLTGMQDPSDMAESARRQALLESVSANDQSLLDKLAAAKEDAQIEQHAAEAAKERALQRTQDTSSRLRELESARKAQARVASAITTRQREVLSEIDEQAKADADLSRIIAEREKQTKFVPGAGSNARSGGCIWPANGTVTSEYGMRWGRLHAGIDIAGPIGSPVWAAKDGEVIFAGQQSGYGNAIMISHGNGLVTLYGHLSRIGVSDGQTVSQGQTIGARGNTGHSTGPHLHFETRYEGKAQNPRGCLR